MNTKRSTKALAFSGIATAVISTVMYLSSIVTVFEYCACVVGGLIVTFIIVEFGTKYALTVYFASSVLSVIIIPTKMTLLLFVLFCGWYSFVKRYLDRLPSFIRILSKLAVFNTSLAAITFITVKFLMTEAIAWYMYVLVFLLADLTFLMYDRLIDKLIFIYVMKYRNKLKFLK